MIRPLAAVPLLVLVAAAPGDAEIEVKIEKPRNSRGKLHLCLTADPKHFPDCAGDPRAVKRSVPAGTRSIRFAGIAPGGYALSVLHDENGNGRLDSFLGIPKEGFGFSRNPIVRFGAPGFRQVRIELKAGFTRETVRMQYLL